MKPEFSKFDVSRETFDRLDTYVELLKRWNPKINLVPTFDLIFEALDFTNEGCTSWKLFKAALQSAHGNTLNKSQITRLYRSYTENVGLPLSTIHFSNQQSSITILHQSYSVVRENSIGNYSNGIRIVLFIMESVIHYSFFI